MLLFPNRCSIPARAQLRVRIVMRLYILVFFSTGQNVCFRLCFLCALLFFRMLFGVLWSIRICYLFSVILEIFCIVLLNSERILLDGVHYPEKILVVYMCWVLLGFVWLRFWWLMVLYRVDWFQILAILFYFLRNYVIPRHAVFYIGIKMLSA